MTHIAARIRIGLFVLIQLAAFSHAAVTTIAIFDGTGTIDAATYTAGLGSSGDAN